jgi:hypothetical protein
MNVDIISLAKKQSNKETIVEAVRSAHATKL